MPEKFEVIIERWPKPQSEGGPGGVFEDVKELAQALCELFRDHGFTFEIHGGVNPVGEREITGLAVKREQADQPDVVVKMGMQLTYLGGRLEAFTGDEFAARFGRKP